MKRSTTEVLRRGFDSTVANWPLIAVRIAESTLFLVLIVGSIFAAVVPILVSAGLTNWRSLGGEPPGQAVGEMIARNAILIVYILLIISVLFLVLMGIHSFVEGGCAKVFVDAERLAAKAAGPSRDRFRAFTMDRWMAGGRAWWWSIFWIYNIAWGIGGLILLVPLLGTIALILIVPGGGPRVAAGCAGLAFTVLLMIPIGIAISVWTQKAIAVCVARAAGASDALRLGWREMGADAGRHFAVALIIIAVSFGGAMVISLGTFPMSVGRSQSPLLGLAFAPAQIAISLVQTTFTSAVGLWFLASFIGLTEERA